ncbi:hypothetical protein ABDD95_17005 [Mucilaginibacter sp. PAMB04274]
MTRKGLFGADGSGLTIYDESAIQKIFQPIRIDNTKALDSSSRAVKIAS